MSEDPLAIDLYCGLGGWAEGFLSEGFKVIGFDIERHDYGKGAYPGHLVLQNVLTLHGRQFKTAAVIVASPPCTEPSYRAMPWKRAKALNAIGPPHQFIELFNACFRIQREASEAAGRHIPLIVENVCGAQPWVGQAAWHFGSYYLWGDIPALMPIPNRARKLPGFRFDGSGKSFQSESVKVSGQNWSNFGKTGEVSPHWRMEATKNDGGSWFNIAHNTTSGKGQNPDGRLELAGIKNENGGPGGWFGSYAEQKARGTISPGRLHGSKSKARKAASAAIAKIPFPLARHIARSFYPHQQLSAK